MQEEGVNPRVGADHRSDSELPPGSTPLLCPMKPQGGPVGWVMVVLLEAHRGLTGHPVATRASEGQRALLSSALHWLPAWDQGNCQHPSQARRPPPPCPLVLRAWWDWQREMEKGGQGRAQAFLRVGWVALAQLEPLQPHSGKRRNVLGGSSEGGSLYIHSANLSWA